jgi:hypothetical protein
MQYACVAFSELRKARVFPIEIVGVAHFDGFPNYVGHNFLILGRPVNAATTIVALERDANADDIFIVDGWANIACSVRTYRTEWKAKMNTWAGKGKNAINPLTNQEESVTGNWLKLFDPNDRQIEFLIRCES